MQLLLLTKFRGTKLSWTMLELCLESSLNMCIKPSHVATPLVLWIVLKIWWNPKTLSNPTHLNLPCTKRLESSVPLCECVINLLIIQDEFGHKLRGLQCWAMTWSTYQLIIKSIVGMPKLAAMGSPPLTWNEEMSMDLNL